VRGFAVGLVLLAALEGLLCLAYAIEMSQTPWAQFESPDAKRNIELAREIAGGQLIGNGTFYQAPLYHYLMGGAFALTGGSLAAIRALQAGGAALSVVLTGLLAWRWSGSQRAGLLAAALHCGCAVFPFYAYQPIKSLTGFVLLQCVLLTWTAGRQPRWRVLAGLSLGLLCLVRENFLALIPTAAVVLAWEAWRMRPVIEGRWRAAIIGFACFVGGAAIPLGLATAHNVAASGEFVIATSQAGQNFYIGNSPTNVSGAYTPPPFIHFAAPPLDQQDFRNEAARRMEREWVTDADASHYWLGEGIAFLMDNPARWLDLWGKKLFLTLSRRSTPDEMDLDRLSRTTLLGWLPISLLAALPLGVIGYVLLGPRRPLAWSLFALALIATLVLFYVWERMRFPLYAFLLPCAGIAVHRLIVLVPRWWTALCHGRTRVMVRISMIFFVGMVWMALSEASPDRLVAPGFERAYEANFHFRLAQLYAEGERPQPEAARNELLLALQAMPDDAAIRAYLEKLDDPRR
jgi:4-amino-4-deoxy-L-arabinose transferase-like glycosyltransferase